eukprot:10691532-Alexandrium_andersonii.AAC.1
MVKAGKHRITSTGGGCGHNPGERLELSSPKPGIGKRWTPRDRVSEAWDWHPYIAKGSKKGFVGA